MKETISKSADVFTDDAREIDPIEVEIQLFGEHLRRHGLAGAGRTGEQGAQTVSERRPLLETPFAEDLHLVAYPGKCQFELRFDPRLWMDQVPGNLPEGAKLRNGVVYRGRFPNFDWRAEMEARQVEIFEYVRFGLEQRPPTVHVDRQVEAIRKGLACLGMDVDNLGETISTRQAETLREHRPGIPHDLGEVLCNLFDQMGLEVRGSARPGPNQNWAITPESLKHMHDAVAARLDEYLTRTRIDCPGCNERLHSTADFGAVGVIDDSNGRVTCYGVLFPTLFRHGLLRLFHLDTGAFSQAAAP